MASIFCSSANTAPPTILARGALEDGVNGPTQLPDRSNTDLRPYNFRNLNYCPSIHAAFIVDCDPTNDFDPEKPHDLQANTCFPKGLQCRSRPFNPLLTPREPKEKVNTWQTGRRQGIIGRISFNLGGFSEIVWASEKGKKVFELLSQWKNNWPATVVLGDEENFSELQLESICEERLRQRSHPLRSLTDNSGNGTSTAWKDVTLGHPAARGCKTCYELGIECTLINGGCYPCLSCEEDENTCELIREPKKKKACENCTKRRVVCSFRTQENHAGPCKACVDKGMTCVAGPKSGFTRDGPSLDFPPPPPPPPPETCEQPGKRQRKNIAQDTGGTADRPAKRQRRARCAQCKESRAWCSLSTHPKAGSCARCRKQGLTCVLDGATIPDVEVVSSRTKCLRYWVYDDKIEFNYEGALPCNWCKCESHGFFGLAHNSEFLQGAHNDGRIDTKIFQGLPSSSRMCFDCTAVRLEIMACLQHKLCRLERAPPDESHDEEENFMLPGMASLAPWKWCMVCPRVARFRCCHSRPSLIEGEPEVCQLRLCRDCACSLTLDHKGDLNSFLQKEEDEWETELDLRADANFLRADGYLIRRFGAPDRELRCDQLEWAQPYLL